MPHFAQRSGEGGWGAARADLHSRGLHSSGLRSPGPDSGPDPGPDVSGLTGWEVAEVTGPAAELHALGIPDPARRLVRRCRPTAPALVLGSTQPDADHAAAGAAGLGVVRRHSGGASVVVGPGRLVWLDVVIPRGDPFWHDDVGVAPLWLGHRLVGLVGEGAAVHEGAMITSAWSRLVCFAGIGPGEVVDAAGRKVIGISQRRTRAAALFQVAILLRWDPAEAVAGLALSPADRHRAAADLAEAAAAASPAPAPAPAPVPAPGPAPEIAAPATKTGIANEPEETLARAAISATTSA